MDDENRIHFCRSCCVGNVLEKMSGTCIVEEVAEDVFRGDPVKSHVVNNENFIALCHGHGNFLDDFSSNF